MCGHHARGWFARLQPPLTGIGHQSHQHLGVHCRRALRVSVLGKLCSKQLLHPGCHIAQQRRQRSLGVLHHGGVPHQHTKTVGSLFDIGEKGDRGPLQESPRMRRTLRKSFFQGPQQRRRLAVNNDRIQSLFSTEVLVHDRFGHACASRDFLHRGGLKPLLREHDGPNGDQLLASLPAGHTRGGPLARCAVAHGSHFPTGTSIPTDTRIRRHISRVAWPEHGKDAGKIALVDVARSPDGADRSAMV